MDAVHPQIEGGPLPGLPDFLFDLLLRLGHDLFDAPRMNPPVRDQPLQGDARHFPPDGIEPGDDHRLGGVVDDQVDARGRLQSADVPPFPSDDAPFHLFVGQVDHGNRLLGHIIGRVALDRGHDDLLGLLVRLALGFLFDPFDQLGRLVAHLALHELHEALLRLVRGDARDLLQQVPLLLDHQVVSLFLFPDRPLLLLDGLFALRQSALLLLQEVDALLQVLLLLEEALFHVQELLPPLLGFLFKLGAGPEKVIFGLDLRLFPNGFRFPFGLFNGLPGFLRGQAGPLGRHFSL